MIPREKIGRASDGALRFPCRPAALWCPIDPMLPHSPHAAAMPFSAVQAFIAGAGRMRALHPQPRERGQEPSLPRCCSPAFDAGPPGYPDPPRCSFATGLYDAQACLHSWSCLPCNRGNVLLLKLPSYSLLLSPSLV